MIEYLEIFNEKIPVRCNRRSIVVFEKKYNKTIKQLDSLSLEELAGFVWLSVIEAYRFQDIKNPYTEETFNDKLDELSPKILYNKLGEVIVNFFKEEGE